MVHKKSEYNMQYNNVSKELRKKIWQDNINFRCNQRSSNQAHHYWDYQVTHDDCDDVDDGEDHHTKHDHKVKHLSLLEKYEKQNRSDLNKLQIEDSASREIGSQTPEWKNEQCYSRLDKPSDEIVHNVSPPSLPVARGRPSSPLPPTSPVRRPRTAMSSCRNIPSKTSRKLHSEGRKTHFVPYGWNEDHNEIGKKKTYNVCAPETQVHDVAILASKRRNISREKFLMKEVEGKNQTLKKASHTASNPSSIWMSEYQEQFSRKMVDSQPRYSRPSSAPPATRHSSSWRFY